MKKGSGDDAPDGNRSFLQAAASHSMMGGDTFLMDESTIDMCEESRIEFEKQRAMNEHTERSAQQSGADLESGADHSISSSLDQSTFKQEDESKGADEELSPDSKKKLREVIRDDEA